MTNYKYKVDLTNELFDELDEAIDEARDLIKVKTNTEVDVYKCRMCEDADGYEEIQQESRVFSIEKYDDGQIMEFTYDDEI